MSNKTIKLIEIGASILGVAATLIGQWVSAKEFDDKVEETVVKVLAKQATKTES